MGTGLWSGQGLNCAVQTLLQMRELLPKGSQDVRVARRGISLNGQLSGGPANPKSSQLLGRRHLQLVDYLLSHSLIKTNGAGCNVLAGVRG